MTPAQNIARRLHSAGYDWRNAVRIAFASHGVFENDLLTAAEAIPITFKGQPKPRAESNPKAKAQAVKEQLG